MRGIIAIFTDLSEAKELEAKVRSADRLSAVGELSASIAHEIRNPLAAISGSVQVLSSEIIVEGDNQKLMNLIVSESDRLTNMLNEFLAYARIDRPVFDKVDLGKLTRPEFSKCLGRFTVKFQPKTVISTPYLLIITDDSIKLSLIVSLVITRHRFASLLTHFLNSQPTLL